MNEENYYAECKRLNDSAAKPTVDKVLPLVRFYYHNNIVGGCGGSLHIFTDDGNCEDNHIEFCKKSATEAGDKLAVPLCDILLDMTMTQREKLYNSDCEGPGSDGYGKDVIGVSKIIISDQPREPDPPIAIMWCKVHNRQATHFNQEGRVHCDPSLPGIMLPCQAVTLIEPGVMDSINLSSDSVRLLGNDERAKCVIVMDVTPLTEDRRKDFVNRSLVTLTRMAQKLTTRRNQN